MNGIRMMKAVLGFSSFVALLAGVMVIPCCTFIETSRVIKQETTRCNNNWAILKKANRAFQQNDYNQATDIYEQLRHSEDELIRRGAMYGLACTRLVLAENADEYKDALILWNSWTRMISVEMKDEDPRMINPFIQGIFLQIINREKFEGVSQSKENLGFFGLVQSREQEIQYLRDKLKSLESENSILKQQNEMMGKEIQILKDQIASFEAIDQKMQEKKKEMSSP